MLLTPKQMVAIGELYLKRGRANGRQVVPASWVDTSCVPRTTSAWDSDRRYGYGWWIQDFRRRHGLLRLGLWRSVHFRVPRARSRRDRHLIDRGERGTARSPAKAVRPDRGSGAGACRRAFRHPLTAPARKRWPETLVFLAAPCPVDAAACTGSGCPHPCGRIPSAGVVLRCARFDVARVRGRSGEWGEHSRDCIANGCERRDGGGARCAGGPVGRRPARARVARLRRRSRQLAVRGRDSRSPRPT